MTSRSALAAAWNASLQAPLADWLRRRGLFYFRRARVVRCDLSGLDRETPDESVEVREASEEDLRVLAAAQGRETADWLMKRARGVLCMVAIAGETPLGYLWITRSAELMAEVDQVLDVSRDTAGAYLFDGYVLPQHRRKGVLRTLLQASKRWGQERGLTRLYAAFARENHASEHALVQAGFLAIVGDVGLLRVLGHDWKWIRSPQGPPTVDVLPADVASRAASSPA